MTPEDANKIDKIMPLFPDIQMTINPDEIALEPIPEGTIRVTFNAEWNKGYLNPFLIKMCEALEEKTTNTIQNEKER